MTPAETIEQEMAHATGPMTRPIVFVVDDDISVRESLELLIRPFFGLVH